MRTVIVLIPVDYDNAKEMAEHLIGKNFYKEFDVLKYIIDNGKFSDDFDDYPDPFDDVKVMSITALVDSVNNEDCDVLINYFAANVNLEIW